MANGPRVRMELKGLSETQRVLQELPDALQKQLVEQTLVESAKPMLDAAIAAAPDAEPTGKGIVDHMFVTPDLNRSQKKSERAPRIDEAKVYVGSSAPQAHLNEWGTGPRHQDTTGRYVGEMPAKPFLRPAFDATAPSVIHRFAERIKIVVEAAAKRLASANKSIVR